MVSLKTEPKEWKVSPPHSNHGGFHNYFGMNNDFYKEYNALIRVDKYVADILEDSRRNMDVEAAIPSLEHLFMVNDNTKILSEGGRQYFHTRTTNLLSLSKRVSTDPQETVILLTTIVNSPYKNDYKKLVRVMEYIQENTKVVLTPETDNTHVVKL